MPVSGAKNSALKLMAATLLAPGKTTLQNVPDISDVHVMGKVLKGMGATIDVLDEHTLEIDTSQVDSWEAPYELVAKMRASTAVMGPLLGRFHRAKIAMPGGCNLGARKIDMHILGLEALGVEFDTAHGYINASAPQGLRGTTVTLEFASVGATENLIMASVRAQGTTVIDNAAREPEIVDLANMLNEMGAKIVGAGTPVVTIEGVEELHPVTHRVVGDRIVDRRKALIDGATGPQWGLLGATFIAICSFLPLYLAPSAVAEIVKPLFVVLAISLGLSWVLALTQTTVFGNFILKAKAKDGTKDPYDKPFYHKFASILRTLIRRKTLTLGSMVVLFVASLVIMGMMPQNFFPSLDKPYFRADVFYPDGYSINDVVKEMKSVEEHLAKQPEVKKVSITFGSTPLRYYLASTSVGPKPNFANVLVELTDSKYTKEYEEDFDAYMKANYPNAITRTSLFKLSPAVDAAIEIGFIGPNVDTLVALTNQALEIMHRNPDLINVRNSWGNKVPVWKPVYSPERAQPLGVSRQGMAQSIQIGTTGMTLGEYRQGDQVLPILLKDNTVDSFRINDLRTLPVFGTGNETTSLEQVVSEFDFQYRFSNVKDYNRQMVMMAQCDPRRGVNAIAAFNEVWPLVQKEIKVPEGYTMKYFGEQESQVESNEALAKNLPLTFFLMFVTLLFLFRTYRKPTVILLMLPLIFIGIVLGLVLLGKSFDFFSILGLLGLIGMNIKNAIVLVEQIDLEAKTGKKPLDAVVSATTSRIVPVAMASGTTILGMLPLLCC